MSTSTRPATSLEELHMRFREIKHDINNSMAVIMALSELAERNPANYEKLGKTVLTRCPDIVHRLQIFGNELGAFAKEVPSARPA
jgi:two-component sensor histidine kinase